MWASQGGQERPSEEVKLDLRSGGLGDWNKAGAAGVRDQGGEAMQASKNIIGSFV